MSVDIERLKQLAQAASPGPWTITEHAPEFDFEASYSIAIGEDDDAICDQSYYPSAPNRIEDARFIAAANPATVLELITELERCRESATRQAGERIVSALEAMIPAIRGEETAQFLRDLVAEWRGPGGGK